MKKPLCLVAAQQAAEALFSIPITHPQLHAKMQQFETLTFNFEFKRERIYKAKKHLLYYLMHQHPEQIPESLIPTILNFVQLVESLVAFAELHFISLKNFSQTMQDALNADTPQQKEIDKIQQHLKQVQQVQKDIHKTALRLPLDEIKYRPAEDLEYSVSQFSDGIGNVGGTRDVGDMGDTKDVEDIHHQVDDNLHHTIQPDQTIMIEESNEQQQELVIETNNEIQVESQEQPQEQPQEQVVIQQNEQSDLQPQEQLEEQPQDQPQEQVEIQSDSQVNSELQSDVVQPTIQQPPQPPINVPPPNLSPILKRQSQPIVTTEQHKQSIGQSTSHQQLPSKPPIHIEDTIQTEISLRKVSMKMATLVSEGVFGNQTRSVSPHVSSQSSLNEAMLTRPTRKARPRTTNFQDQSSHKQISLFK